MPLFEIGKDPPPWTRMYQTCFAGCDPYKPEGGLPDKETVEAYYKAFGNKKKINLISKHKIVNFKNQKS